MPHLNTNIIILNWNGWEDTISCIGSIKNTICIPPFNIIVIDNCSSDDSVERITATFPEIEIIQNDTNLGFGGGCNVGLLRSLRENVEFVWLVNNDTKVFTDSLQELLIKAEEEPNAGIIGSVIYHMDNPDKIQAWGGGHINFWTGSAKYILNTKDSAKLQYITGASMLIRTKALREVGIFDVSPYFMYWEDADLCFRFAQKGWRLAVAQGSTVLHKESASFKNSNYLLVRYFNQSAVVFFCKFYRFCLIPVLVGLSGRLVKRILRQDGAGLKEIMLIFKNQFKNTFSRLLK